MARRLACVRAHPPLYLGPACRFVASLQASAQASHKQQRLAEPSAKVRLEALPPRRRARARLQAPGLWVTGVAPDRPQDKRKAAEERQKELNLIFALAIKQPKVPEGVPPGPRGSRGGPAATAAAPRPPPPPHPSGHQLTCRAARRRRPQVDCVRVLPPWPVYQGLQVQVLA
jgi:hypothetical protein